MKTCNDKKKVCIIRSNPVKPDSRVEKEAWTLYEAGYDVYILAWDRDTNQYETETYVEVAEVKLPITRLGHKASYGDGFKNLKPYLMFQIHMRKWIKTHDFDVVHACDFDTAFFSQSIVKRKKEKFIFDIFDFLYGEPHNYFQKCIKKAQLRIINNSDGTIICTEERKKQIIGSNPKRLAIIHNTPAVIQIGNTNISMKKTNKIKIAYIGILQDYRLLKEVAEVVSETEYLELHIGGFGKYEKYFIDMARKYKNIKFYGKLNYNQTLQLEKQCDIMLAIYDPSIENHRFAAPNKFYEGLMLGKPLIMVKATGMAQIVEDNNIGVLIEYSKEGFLKGILELIANKNEWERMSTRMKELYQINYNWDEMRKRLLKFYEEL